MIPENINYIINKFVNSEMYSGHPQTSKLESSATIVQPLTIAAKFSLLDVCGSLNTIVENDFQGSFFYWFKLFNVSLSITQK